MNLGIDIGGTFTDIILVLEDGQGFFSGKVLTTPKDPSIGAIQGLESLLKELGLAAGQVKKIIHGTTLVANALIERRGARTGLITTKGFRDILEIGREKRYDVYDIFLEMPEPLVPRRLRLEVTERMGPDGTVVIKLDEKEARQVTSQLKREEVESIAVSFLHSFRNPEHELVMGRILEEVAPGLFVSLSHQVMPEIREYERTCTTVANAYTQPLVTRYLERFEEQLARLGFKGSFFVMLSSGGTAQTETARRFPVRIVESGPAAGAIAAAHLATLVGQPKAISFDMGGTTAKICLIEEGVPRITTDFEVGKIYRFKKGSGLPIRLPVIEMVEIGAGGGSLARVDALGLLKVGPESAGADPGPCCYQRGGTQPTVTDADLLLGFLDPNFFLGGRMPLDKELAAASIEEKVARPLGVDLIQAAWGIHQVVNENMANAARIHAVEKGEDPKSYSLIAFGGAGPGHAYGLCQRLGIKKIICPLRAGVISALGFLLAPLSFDLVRSYVSQLDQIEPSTLNALLQEMESEGIELLQKAGVLPDQLSLARTAEMRYQGQGHEIVVPLPKGPMSLASIRQIQEAFDREYTRLFHRTIPDTPVVGLNWRACMRGPTPTLDLRAEGIASGPALKGKRPVYFPQAGGFVQTRVYDRLALTPGTSLAGPAVVEEKESTLVMGPGSHAFIDPYLNLIMTLD